MVGEAQWQELASSSPVVLWLACHCWHTFWYVSGRIYGTETRGESEKGPPPDRSGVAGLSAGGYR